MLGGIHFFSGSVLAASFSSTPIGSFLIGVASHHILDSLPHFDTNLFSQDKKKIKNWTKEIWFVVLLEFIGFLILTILFFFEKKNFWLNVLFGGIGGIFPDIFTIYFGQIYQTKNKFIKQYLKFHTQTTHCSVSIKDNLKLTVFVYYLIFFLDIILIFGLV